MEAVCEMARSGMDLPAIAEKLGIAKTTLWRRCGDSEPYARARDAGIGLLFEEMLEVARKKPADQVEAAHQRNLLDTFKWALQRRVRDTYGDRTEVAASGNVTVTVVTGVPAAEQP